MRPAGYSIAPVLVGVALATPLLEALLALAIAHAPPGRSPYSLEVVPECGTDRARPECKLERRCTEPKLSCRAPRWSRARNAWVRVEPRRTAIRRYSAIATAIDRTARELAACTKPECEPLKWPGSTRSLALAALAIALHESGLREDIQFGRAPLGRGPAREACLVQVSPKQAPLYASWVPQGQRQALADDRERREAFAETLLGDSPAALGRCFEVGMRMLARARRACRSTVPWSYGMYSMYGSGHTCNLPGVADARHRTFQRLLSAKPKLSDEARRLAGWAPASQPGGTTR